MHYLRWTPRRLQRAEIQQKRFGAKVFEIFAQKFLNDLHQNFQANLCQIITFSIPEHIQGKVGMFWTSGQSGQVDFLENTKMYQHHFQGVYARSLDRQLMLYGDETRQGVLACGEILFFERLMYILICYHNVLYLLNSKLLFCLAIMVLLGCLEFNLNVTCVGIHVCSRIAVPHADGASSHHTVRHSVSYVIKSSDKSKVLLIHFILVHKPSFSDNQFAHNAY